MPAPSRSVALLCVAVCFALFLGFSAMGGGSDDVHRSPPSHQLHQHGGSGARASSQVVVVRRASGRGSTIATVAPDSSVVQDNSAAAPQDGVHAPPSDDTDAHPASPPPAQAPPAGLASSSLTPMHGSCTHAAASVFADGGSSGSITVDGPAVRLAEPFRCPLLWSKEVKACGAMLGGGRLIGGGHQQPKPAPIADLRNAVSKKSKADVIAILDGVCAWDASDSSAGKGDERFELGDEARAVVGSMQHAFDCAPPDDAGIAATAHHLPTTTIAGSTRRAAEAYDLRSRLFKQRGALPPIPQAPKDSSATVQLPEFNTAHVPDGKAATKDFGALEPGRPDSVAYRAAEFKGKSFYKRPQKASFVRLDNVCMTCDPRRQFFMNPKRRCATTVWSIKEILLGIESKARKGRHGIFKEREGGFQYGGPIQPPKDALVIRGTTFYVTHFGDSNVGHVIRDAAWMYHLVTYARNKSAAQLPYPHHAMLDADLYETSSDFHNFLTLVSALRNLGGGGEDTPPTIDDDVLNPPRGGSGSAGSPPLLLNPATAPGSDERLVCFETVVFSGRDRAGLSGRLAGRSEVAAHYRREVLSFLGAPPAVAAGRVTRAPRLFVYGRQDVHRRRIDNVGALTAALLAVTRELGLLPPTVITTMYTAAGRQVELFAGIDVLVSVQGAHLEQHLFMPDDAAILEIAQCSSRRTSFVSRYGTYHAGQTFKQLSVCSPRINFSDRDKRAQDLLLCPHHLKQVQAEARAMLAAIVKKRRRNGG